MNLFRIQRIIKLDFQQYIDVELIQFKYSKSLNAYNFRTDSEGSIIEFSRKNIPIGSNSRKEILNPFKNGQIMFERSKYHINIM